MKQTGTEPETRLIWTIGHSTRTAEVFLGLLIECQIQVLADVRRFPGSRRHPHFGRSALAEELMRAGIAYEWMPDLGGRRRPRQDSPNVGWRNAAFRGYADYMQTSAFEVAFEALGRVALCNRTAIMCAEALWWQCHRRLIADALVARRWQVMHIRESGMLELHRLLPPARVENGHLSYAVERAANVGQSSFDL